MAIYNGWVFVSYQTDICVEEQGSCHERGTHPILALIGSHFSRFHDWIRFIRLVIMQWHRRYFFSLKDFIIKIQSQQPIIRLPFIICLQLITRLQSIIRFLPF